MRHSAALLMVASLALGVGGGLGGCTEFEVALEEMGSAVGNTLDDAFGTSYASDKNRSNDQDNPGVAPDESTGRMFATAEQQAPTPRATPAATQPERDAPADPFADPLAVSALRERAWDALAALAKDEDPQVRANALEAMAQTPHRAEPILVAALKDPNAGVRSTAAMMIGRLKLADAAAAARLLVDDPSPFARASAIYALSRCGQPVDSTPLARMLLTNPSLRVRSHVAFLLGELGEPSAAGLLREAARSTPARESGAEQKLFLAQVSEALVKLGEQSQVEPIRAHLYPSRPEDLEATALAAQILGQLKDKGSVNELIYLTAYKDSQGNRMPAEIRLAAAGSLARLGLDKGSFVADEYAGSELAVLRAQSAFVYGEIGRRDDLAKLERLMGDSAGMVRVSAAGAVLKVRGEPVAAR